MWNSACFLKLRTKMGCKIKNMFAQKGIIQFFFLAQRYFDCKGGFEGILIL